MVLIYFLSIGFIYRYGLILQKKSTSQSIIQRPSVFNEESDSENSNHGDGDWRATAFKVNNLGKPSRPLISHPSPIPLSLFLSKAFHAVYLEQSLSYPEYIWFTEHIYLHFLFVFPFMYWQ